MKLSRRSPTIQIVWLCLGAYGCADNTHVGQTRHQTDHSTAFNRPVDEDCENTFPVDILPENPDADIGVRIPNEAALPNRLSETGLYADIATKTVHPAYKHFIPQFALWSDDATKHRWVYIPECDTVDTSDINNWSLPVGTRLFKEFQVEGQRVETRVIERLGPRPRDFAYASYLWNADESDATKVSAAGISNALGTHFDIPSKDQCLQCHGSHATGGGRPSRALGFSSFQLDFEDTELSLDTLKSAGAISHALPSPLNIPGTPEDQAALGYLHANCGHCHNDTPDRIPQVSLNLWLDAGLERLEDTAVWRTAVDQPTEIFNDQHVFGRIVPGQPSKSALLYRMKQRGNRGQMPPVGTEFTDPSGIAIISDWIGSME